MHRTMMPATQWDSKLITDLAAERARLGKVQGGGCSEGLRPADETCLLGDLAKVLAFAIAALALLFLPVLTAALARNVALALTASLLSFTSLMLFIAPASATGGLAIVSGLGSFLVALESVIARRRMMAFDKQLADLTS